MAHNFTDDWQIYKIFTDNWNFLPPIQTIFAGTKREELHGPKHDPSLTVEQEFTRCALKFEIGTVIEQRTWKRRSCQRTFLDTNAFLMNIYRPCSFWPELNDYGHVSRYEETRKVTVLCRDQPVGYFGREYQLLLELMNITNQITCLQSYFFLGPTTRRPRETGGSGEDKTVTVQAFYKCFQMF